MPLLRQSNHQREVVIMTVQTVDPGHRLSPRLVVLSILALALAVLLGFGIAALTLDEDAATTPVTFIDGANAQPGAADHEEKLRERQFYLDKACAEGLIC